MATMMTTKRCYVQHNFSYDDNIVTTERFDVVDKARRRCSNSRCHSGKDHQRRRSHRSSAERKTIMTGMTTMKIQIAMMAVLCTIITMIINESTAFVVISPTTTTKKQIPNTSRRPMDNYSKNLLYPIGSQSPSPPSSYFSRARIRQQQHRSRTSLIFASTTEDSNNESNTNKKPEQNQMNKNTRKINNKGNNNNNNSSNNTNNNSNKKSNQGGIKRKKSKSSSSSEPKSKKKPLDPSKQKKREIMEQIKAKIKEEGEEKKMKEKQNQKPKDSQQQQQQPRQKPNQSRSKSNADTPTTQARLQKLGDEDPPESIFDEDDLDGESAAKRKKLFMNPFEAGKSFRETLQNLSTLGLGLQLPKETKDKYFLDDRLLDGDDADSSSKSPKSSSSSSSNTIAGALFSSSSLLQRKFNSKTASGLLQEYAEAEALAPISYIPEVLVVGATGEIGRLVVRRLLLEGSGRFRVRVLVRDLYSQTLNLLGTGVSYCQGDLSDVESLEYALTDVDKIVYVAGAPKPDETDFQKKFKRYLEEHDLKLSSSKKKDANSNANASANSQLNDLEWEQMASVLEVRSELAEQVDCIGMKNLVSAFQNVRHTDYGTSQAAKRSLFKFSKKSGDFGLFALDDSDDDDDTHNGSSDEPNYDQSHACGDEEYDEDQDDDEDNYGSEEYDEDKYVDEYDDEYDDDDENYGLELESRNARDSNVVKAQVRWLRNKFDNGVFVGRVPRADGNNPSANPGGAEASIISSRLRAREDPDQGIDMNGFAGFILRVISDGNNYEAFVRTGLYETDGVEYVYEYSTDSKRPTADNKSQSRFKTIRLAFENFKPVQRRKSKTGEEYGNASEEGDDEDEFEDDDDDDDDVFTVPPFVGSDVRYLGFRFRSSSNIRDKDNAVRNSLERFSRGRNDRDRDYQRFYMALSYIKVYRAQPEPEFIYLSDARIPPVIRDGMVQHQRKVLLTDDEDLLQNHPKQQQRRSKKNNNNQDGGASETSDAKVSSSSTSTTLLDEKDLQRKSKLERSPEETYFKYRGEEILIKSGLSYTIIRVAGFNELSTSEASTIDLVKSNSETSIVPVSRAEVAQVCVSALLDPCALNKCVYMTKKTVAGKNVLDEEDISAKFEGIPTDVIL